MKQAFMTLLFLGFLVSRLQGQASDSLKLDIKSLKKTGIILKYSGQNSTTLSEELNRLNNSSGTWIFSIRSNPVQNAYVVISNTEGEAIASAKLADLNKSYLVRNDSLIEKGVAISGPIRIDVFQKNNNQLLKSFPITFTSTTTNEGSRTGPDAKEGYKLGSMAHDAIYLANESASPAVKAQILSYYASGKTKNALQTEYSSNPFLDSLANDILITRGQQGKIGLGSVFSSIGGLDVTSFADGAARFIVKRAKQELSIAFFKKFRKVISETRDIATVFPQTANLLDAMDEELYDYEKYLQNLRESFKKDLVEIHRNLPGIIDNHHAFFSAHQPAKAALLTACYTAQELETQTHPGDILAGYPVAYLDSITNKNYKAAIQTVQLLSASLRETSETAADNYWVGIKIIRELVHDRNALKFYLGLLLQEAKNKYAYIPFENISLAELLAEAGTQYDASYVVYNSYRNYVLRFGEKLESLNKMIREQDNGGGSDSAVLEKYARYFRSAIDLIEYGTQTSTLPVAREHLPNLKVLMGKYFGLAYTAADLVVNINRRNYSAVVNAAVNIYNLVTVKATADTAMVISGSSVSSLRLADNNKTDFKTTLNKLVRYGSFMASIATAKNSVEVERAIESAALPVGSSRVKRVSDFNVSLNAYAGLFYGVERIQEYDRGGWNANVYGVTAPIGVASSWGHRLFFIKTKQEWSTTIYLSLIDLGAVAAFRFTNDSTEQIPTIRLKNIFSPGAFLSLGIPNTPLSFSLGAQVGPNLRKVIVAPGKDNAFADNIYWRFSTSLAVDIPLLNFHTRSK